MRNNNIIIQYVIDWRLIPSNILKAFMNNKNDAEVNKKEILEISIVWSKKENLISVIKIFFSINNKQPMTKAKSSNFKLGDNIYLSSKNPIIKKKELKIQKL